MASGNIVGQVLRILPPATAYATADVRAGGSTPAESVLVYDFDDTTAEYLDFLVYLGANYSGGGLTIVLPWSATSATADGVVWQVAIRRMQDDAEDIDTSHTYDFNTVADTCASVSGELSYPTLAFTSGADMDSWAAGELAILRVGRLPTDGSDTMAGDAELWGLIVKET